MPTMHDQQPAHRRLRLRTLEGNDISTLSGSGVVQGSLVTINSNVTMFNGQRVQKDTKSTDRGKKQVLDTFITYMSTDPNSVGRKLDQTQISSRNLKIYNTSLTERQEQRFHKGEETMQIRPKKLRLLEKSVTRNFVDNNSLRHYLSNQIHRQRETRHQENLDNFKKLTAKRDLFGTAVLSRRQLPTN